MHLLRITLTAGLLAGAGAALAAGSAVTVTWGPQAQHDLRNRYGTDQKAVLQEALLQSLEPQLDKLSLPAGARVIVMVEHVAPTHPTPRQSADNPSLDPFATKYVGGARLRGTIEDADGHALTAVSYSYYPLTLRLGSVSKDAWADARLAFERFASRLAGAVQKLPARR